LQRWALRSGLIKSSFECKLEIEMKRLKQRLKNNEVLIGTFLSLGNALATEIIASSGFDWVLIDLEHGIGSEEDVLHQLQAIEHTNVSAIVRVEGYQRQRIHRVLDLGAHGIMCPRINNATEADEVIKGLQYPPLGIRGVAKMVRATGFGANFDQYNADIKENLLGIIQIETKECLENLDEIAALPGVDVLFIGPADLSMSLGIFGQLSHPLFIEALDKILAAAKKWNKSIGILLFDPADFTKYYDLGIRFFACGTDTLFLSSGAKQVVGSLQKQINEVAINENKNG
jgi:4-hydroxy-2-oxoheptanedioate aldolase